MARCWLCHGKRKQESPAVADKPRATRKNAKIAPIRRENKFRQVNDLLEVMEMRCLLIKFLIKITSRLRITVGTI